MPNSTASPGLLRRLASLFYDFVLLLAVLMFTALIFLFIFGDATAAPKRYFFQIYLWLISAAYFVWNWTRGGQTLAMQTWRIKLAGRHGEALTPSLAMKRYILASVFLGVSFVWALFDREGCYLHDRLSGTRLTLLEKRPEKN